MTPAVESPLRALDVTRTGEGKQWPVVSHFTQTHHIREGKKEIDIIQCSSWPLTRLRDEHVCYE